MRELEKLLENILSPNKKINKKGIYFEEDKFSLLLREAKEDEEEETEDKETDGEIEEEDVGEDSEEEDDADEEKIDPEEDTDEDSEESDDEEVEDPEEETEVDTDEKVSYNKKEVSGLKGVALQIAQKDILNNFYRLKNTAEKNLKNFSAIRSLITEKDDEDLFDRMITEMEEMIENLDTYITFRLPLNAYSTNLDVHINFITQLRLLISVIEKIADKHIKKKK